MSDYYDHEDEREIEQLLIGHSVSVEDGVLVLDNGTRLVVHPNEGCGGCDSGWYYLQSLNGCANAITGVMFDVDGDDSDTPTHFRIFVYADGIPSGVELVHVAGDDGNGYYGTGYSIEVTYPRDEAK